MTTIAWDGKILAADRLVTRGDVIYDYQDKIYKLKNGDRIACAGSCEDTLKVIEWLENGSKSNKPTVNNFQAILVTTEGEAY